MTIKATPTLKGARDLKRRPGDGGIDVSLPQAVIIPPGATMRVDIGWAFEMPDDWHLLALQKSRHAGIMLVEAPLIDNSYRGTVHALLRNINDTTAVLDAGTKVMQLLPVHSPHMEILVVDPQQLSITERGDGAFGSTEEDTSLPPHTTTHVTNLPDCEICKGEGAETLAYADANIPGLGWGYVCRQHFNDLGCRLGLGLGQELLTNG